MKTITFPQMVYEAARLDIKDIKGKARFEHIFPNSRVAEKTARYYYYLAMIKELKRRAKKCSTESLKMAYIIDALIANKKNIKRLLLEYCYSANISKEESAQLQKEMQEHCSRVFNSFEKKIQKELA